MKHFIRLTSMVINKSHITKIVHQDSKYYINMTSVNTEGFMMFASGNIWSRSDIIEICNTINEQDYDTITDFISKIK